MSKNSKIPALENQFCILGYEFFFDYLGTTTHNPHLALIPKTQKEFKEWYSKKVAHDVPVVFLDAKEMRQAWDTSDQVYRKLPLLISGLDEKYDKTKHTREDVLEFYVLHAKHPNQTKYEIYRTWPKCFVIYDFIWGVISFYKDQDCDNGLSKNHYRISCRFGTVVEGSFEEVFKYWRQHRYYE